LKGSGKFYAANLVTNYECCYTHLKLSWKKCGAYLEKQNSALVEEETPFLFPNTQIALQLI
jgi:hypothetical protein